MASRDKAPAFSPLWLWLLLGGKVQSLAQEFPHTAYAAKKKKERERESEINVATLTGERKKKKKKGSVTHTLVKPRHSQRTDCPSGLQSMKEREFY